MSEKKQSSIEWFYQRILAKDINEVFDQAKAMHQEEIKDAWYNSLTKADYLSGDEYYKKTFEK